MGYPDGNLLNIQLFLIIELRYYKYPQAELCFCEIHQKEAA